MLCRSSHCFFSCSHWRRTLSGTESESRNVTKYVQPSCRQCGRFRWYMRTARRSSNGTKHVGRRTEFIPFLDSRAMPCQTGIRSRSFSPHRASVGRAYSERNEFNSTIPGGQNGMERNEFRSTGGGVTEPPRSGQAIVLQEIRSGEPGRSQCLLSGSELRPRRDRALGWDGQADHKAGSTSGQARSATSPLDADRNVSRIVTASGNRSRPESQFTAASSAQRTSLSIEI